MLLWAPPKAGKFLLSIIVLTTLAACGKHANPATLKQDEPLSPDIVAEFVGAATIADGEIEFQIKFTNQGADMDEEAQLFSKAFLFPKLAYATTLAGQGFVTEAFDVALNLAAGAAATFTVKRNLPTMAAGRYFFGVTINTRAAPIPKPDEDDSVITIPGRPPGRPGKVAAEFVPEALLAQSNNVTSRLLDLGELPAYQAAPKSGKYDLYHEVSNAVFSLDGAIASHQSRNILRVMAGDDQVPDEEHWDNDISARFLFLDPEKGTAQIGMYTEMDVDKVWTAVSWQPEFDRQGKKIHVDYYPNAPLVSGLAPGKYVLGVIMNITDRFTLDSFPENNLDLTHLELTEQRLMKLPKELWLNGTDEDGQDLMASIFGEAEDYEWSFEITDQPAWLLSSADSWDYGYEVSFTLAPDTPLGIYEIEVTVQAKKGDTVHREKTKLIVVKTDGPQVACEDIGQETALKPADANVQLIERNGVRFMSVNFGLRNKGNRDLLYSFDAWNHITFETPARRVIAPGEKHLIKFTLPLVGVTLPRQDEEEYPSVYAWLKTNIGNRSCDIRYDVKAMLEHPIE